MGLKTNDYMLIGTGIGISALVLWYFVKQPITIEINNLKVT